MAAGNPFDDIERYGQGLVALNDDVAAEASGELLATAQKHLRAGQEPDGTPWPAKKDGGQALTGAAGALTVSTKGATIELKIGGGDNARYVFHDHGAGAKSETAGAERARRKHARDQEKRRAAGERVGASKFHAPARKILPSPSDPVPASYSRALDDASERAFARVGGGK